MVTITLSKRCSSPHPSSTLSRMVFTAKPTWPGIGGEEECKAYVHQMPHGQKCHRQMLCDIFSPATSPTLMCFASTLPTSLHTREEGGLRRR